MVFKVVEQLSVVNGVVAAIGFADTDAPPRLLFDGQPIKNQLCARFRRPSEKDKHGLLVAEPGFRIAALVDPGHIPDYSKLAVQFADGEINRRSLPNISDAHAMLNEFIAETSSRPGSSMIELGSRARSGTVYKTRFPSLGRYVGVDISPGPNVDVVADAHTLSSSIKEKFDFGFSISVFEHLMMPWVAAYELNKVMKTGGLIFMQSHPTYPLHEEPWDFFRFSTHAWASLFNKFTGFEIIKTGNSLEASIVPLNATNGAMQFMDRSKTWLVSACIARKVGEPTANWAADPASIANLAYSHGPQG